MFYAAGDTTWLERPMALAKRSNSFNSDTIPLVMFNFDYRSIKNVALNNPGYFSIDTANNTFGSISNPIANPYNNHEIFAVGMGLDYQNFKNATYRIDPDFFITDNRNFIKTWNTSELQLVIDFGDGLGWLTFDQTQVTHHDVVYPDSGEYTIRVAFVQGSDTINYSSVNKRVLQGTETIIPDDSFVLNGMRISIFNGCTDQPQPNEDKKFVIYLEGIDVMDFIPVFNRNASLIYEQMIKEEQLVELRNFGYSFVVVDWVNSRRDIKQNAMSVVSLLDYLKCEYPESDHEFVVIGESMGGLVGRYALAFMETDMYQSGYHVQPTTPLINIYNGINSGIGKEACRPELMHKTRLFITFDTPHQGANIPLAYQELYITGADKLFGGRWFSPIVRTFATDFFNLFLGADAAKQMLLMHAESKDAVSLSNEVWDYSPHAKKEEFFEDLENIGNYPRFTKLMALSNGSISGEGQARPYNGVERTPFDVLLQFNGQIYGKVLGIEIPVFGANLDMRTNPNGYGKFFEIGIGTWGVKVKLYWFGVDVNAGLISFVSNKKIANNAIPYCVNAGGIFGGSISSPAFYGIQGSYDVSNPWWTWIIGGLNYNLSNDGNGTFSFNASVGIPWAAQAGVSFDMYSDGIHFNFVPVASALDWGNIQDPSQDLSPNIQTTAWPARVNNSRFDVISGIHSTSVLIINSFFWTNFTYMNNRSHLNVENSKLFTNNLNNSFIHLTSCRNMPTYVINREIGDEILWLNNRTLPYNSRFEAEREIFVNAGNNNPHYEYQSGNGNQLTQFRGYYSKERSFEILPLNPVDNTMPMAVFKFEENYAYQEPLPQHPEQAEQIQADLWICCFSWEEYKTDNDVDVVHTEQSIDVYPNPMAQTLNIKTSNAQEGNYVLCIYNAMGAKVECSTFEMLSNDIHVISTEGITIPGMYVAILTNDNGKTIATFKLIKN